MEIGQPFQYNYICDIYAFSKDPAIILSYTKNRNLHKCSSNTYARMLRAALFLVDSS